MKTIDIKSNISDSTKSKHQNGKSNTFVDNNKIFMEINRKSALNEMFFKPNESNNIDNIY